MPGLGLLPALASSAAPATATATTSSAANGAALTSLVQTSLSLVLVLALILGLAWLAKRLKLTPANRSADLTVLAEVAVGMKERVVLIRVGDAQALVGVGADGVRSLSLLDRPVAIREAIANDASFAARFAEAIKPVGK